MNICLAILNYNGIHHLQELLPTALEAVKYYGEECPIIVLDNRSTNDDVQWIGSNFQGIETIVAPHNDYLFSYNWLLNQRKEDVVILLNNDLRLSNNLIPTLMQHFLDPEVFAASCKAYSWDGKIVNSGPCTIRTHRGAWLISGYAIERQYPSYTLFCSGGFMAVDRKKFLKLGGFDRLFYPAYGEDKDIGMRAWCEGWKSIYEPRCFVYHREGGSWDQSGKNISRPLIERSDYFIMWRNVRKLSFRVRHQLYLAGLTYTQMKRDDVRWLIALKEAKLIWRKRKCAALRLAPKCIDLAKLEALCGSRI
jgi:GT2 family glycosyltransferase